MRRFASRALLVGLVVVLIVFIIRRAGSPGDALAHIDDIEAERSPEHEAFRLTQPVRVTIEAAGSFEGGEADTALAAHGWLVHRESGTVAWRMRPAQRPERGTFVLMRDTVTLAPGTYDAYFTSLGVPEARTTRQGGTFRERLGDALRGGGKGWAGDAPRWRFLVRFAPGQDHEGGEQISDQIPEPDDLVWGTGPARSDDLHEVVLRATEPVRIRLDAVFEAAGEIPRDSAYFMTMTGDTLWVARPATSEHAGGSLRNRRQSDTLSLGPGRYRAVFRTDDSHAYDDWDANPPWEPWRWGLRISPADSASRAGAIAPADPLDDLPRLVDLSCVEEESTTREVRFEVSERLEVTLVAVGEFDGGRLSGGDSYDYAELLRGGSTVWDMRRETRRPAGGADKNQRADKTLWLDPGVYTLRYTTDSSHQCGDYNSTEPDRVDFWGVVVLSTDGEESNGRVRIMEEVRGIPQDVLARILRVGNNENRTATFQLPTATDVCVLVLGEISDSERYDWGAVSGPTSWSMNKINSFPAGGNALNRMSITYLTLQPGSYTVRYQSDSSHAWDEWSGSGAPDNPEYWGIQVWEAPESAREMQNPRRACVPRDVEVPDGEIAQAPPASPNPPPPPEPEEPEIFDVVEQSPELIGGLDGLAARVDYPEEARRAGVEGKVFVQFVVDEDGDVQQAVCARTPDQRLCSAAVDAVEDSQFRPGFQRGRPVRVRYTLPVDFSLR